MTRITAQDCRDLKLCMPGVRRLVEFYGFDFKAFVRDGIAVDDLPQDAQIAPVIERAKQREQENARVER